VTMELLSLLFTLRPIAADPSPAPFWWGRAAQALFLSAVSRVDPALAARLHDEQSPHPYTVSTLLGHFPGGRIDPNATYTLRLTASEPGLANLLHGLASDGELAPGQEIALDRRPFKVEQVAAQPGEHPWVGCADYAGLVAEALASSAPPPRRISLHWASPTAFRSKGRDVPLPLPELVFGGLLERWNACSPVAFPPETRRYADECLFVSRYDLSTRLIQVKDGAQRLGAAGQVTFSTSSYDRYWMGVLRVLAAYSLFAGVGAGVSHGMGQCRLIEE